MDPKDLEELKKLKEQKYADLEKLQELARMSIPDFEAAEQTSPDEASGETIKFSPVINPSDEQAKRRSGKGGNRGKKPSSTEVSRKRRKIRKWIVRIVLMILLVLIIWSLVGFFKMRNENRTRHAYYYWGMGAAIENATEEYAFDGNIIKMTQYDILGNVKAIAEFKNGNCVKETVYNSDGTELGYYTHQYNAGMRNLTAYYEGKKLIHAVKYTLDEQDPTKVYGEKIYYLEDNRIENLILNLDTKGNVLNETILSNGKIARVNTYSQTDIIETKIYDSEENLMQWKSYEYNPSGLPTSESIYGADNKLVSRTETEYSTIGLPTKVTRYSSDGSVRDYEIFGYDANRNPTKYVHYTGYGTVIEQIIRIYNSKNLVTKETGMNAEGDVTYCYGYDYDASGNVSRKVTYNNDNNALMDGYTVYTRDANGLILKTEEFDTNNRIIAKASYNTMGLIAEAFRYSASGSVAEKTTYLYDDLQRMLKKTVTMYNEASQEICFIEEQFNVLGSVTVRVAEDFVTGEYYQHLFHYAADGMLTGQSEFDKNGRLTSDKSFDVIGQITKEVVYVTGRETFTYIYSYDSSGNVIRKIVTDHLAAETKQYNYTYNPDNQIQEELISDKDGVPLTKLEYDYDGYLTSKVNYRKGEVYTTVIYTYNGFGQLEEESTFDKRGKLKTTKVYSYAEDGSQSYVEYDDDGKVIGQSKN